MRCDSHTGTASGSVLDFFALVGEVSCAESLRFLSFLLSLLASTGFESEDCFVAGATEDVGTEAGGGTTALQK